MAIRYSGDVEIRMRLYEGWIIGAVRSKDVQFRDKVRVKAGAGQYDRAARLLLAEALRRHRLPIERQGTRIVLRSVFQAPCPTTEPARDPRAKTFRVYRIESQPGNLSGKNAGNLRLLMAMLQAKARPPGSRVSIYNVRARAFGPYVGYNTGQGHDRQDPRVGYVRDSENHAFYSFPSGGQWTANLVASLPIALLLARLRVQGPHSVQDHLRKIR